MRKFLLFTVLLFSGCLLTTIGFAQVGPEAQPFGGNVKIEAYTEYINFDDDDIDGDAWGGGILARCMLLKYLGLQANVTMYSDCETDELGGDLSFTNLRLSVIFHSHIQGMEGPLPIYVYGGGGLGCQFNSEVGDKEVDDALTGNIIGGIGYDFPERFFIEAEGGYQFGKAKISGYTDSKVGIEAVFIRMGVGVKF